MRNPNRGLKVIRSVVLLLALAGCSNGEIANNAMGDTVARAAGKQTTACQSSVVVTDPAMPDSPAFVLDPMGPMQDVSCDWQRYQPAEAFCIRVDGPVYTPGGVGAQTDGTDPVCRFSGFAPTDKELYRVTLTTPLLCAGCRRIFIDFSRIADDQPDQQKFYAHAHVFYKIAAFNPTYSEDPDAHSPNTKNFYNDKLVSPPGTPLELVTHLFDSYSLSYVTDTRYFIHTAIQGGHYIGPWYVNRNGERIQGIYVDVNVGDATNMANPFLNAFRYLAGYNSGQITCPDNASAQFADADLLYAGCVDRAGGSAIALDPLQ